MMLIPQGTQTKLSQIAFKTKVVITAVLFYFGFFFFFRMDQRYFAAFLTLLYQNFWFLEALIDMSDSGILE